VITAYRAYLESSFNFARTCLLLRATTALHFHFHHQTILLHGPATMLAHNGQRFVSATPLSPRLLGSRALFVALAFALLSPRLSNLRLFLVALLTTPILPRWLRIYVLFLTSPLRTIRIVICTYLVKCLLLIYQFSMQTRQTLLRELEASKIDREDSSATLCEWPTISSSGRVAATSLQSRTSRSQPLRAATKRKAEHHPDEVSPAKRHEVIKLQPTPKKATLFVRLIDLMSFESTLQMDEIAQLASKSSRSSHHRPQ
jgi:hypothetical protein